VCQSQDVSKNPVYCSQLSANIFYTVYVPYPWKTGGDDTKDNGDPNHRGRAKVHALQLALRTELLACQDHKAFWDFVRKHTDARPKKSKVSLADLSADRLNCPPAVPASLNSDQLEFNARMARELAYEPADISPRQSYTREITLEDIEDMKKHIKEHGLDTALASTGSPTKTAWPFQTRNY
jgi:hypothetical protein